MDRNNIQIIDDINSGKIKHIQDYIDIIQKTDCSIVSYGVNSYSVANDIATIISKANNYIKLVSFLEIKNYIKISKLPSSCITNTIHVSVVNGVANPINELNVIFRPYEYSQISPTLSMDSFIKNGYVSESELAINKERFHRKFNTWISIIIGLCSISFSTYNIISNRTQIHVQSINYGLEFANKLPASNAIPIIDSMYDYSDSELIKSSIYNSSIENLFSDSKSIKQKALDNLKYIYKFKGKVLIDALIAESTIRNINIDNELAYISEK